MEMMIHGKYINQGENLSKVLEMRRKIFGTGEDEKDKEAVHILLSLLENAGGEETPIGCGRLNLDLEVFRFHIDCLGVLEEFRRQGYGGFGLRALVDKVKQCGADRVFIEKEKIHAAEAEGFFRKLFFEELEEEPRFLCANIDMFHTCCHLADSGTDRQNT